MLTQKPKHTCSSSIHPDNEPNVLQLVQISCVTSVLWEPCTTVKPSSLLVHNHLGVSQMCKAVGTKLASRGSYVVIPFINHPFTFHSYRIEPYCMLLLVHYGGKGKILGLEHRSVIVSGLGVGGGLETGGEGNLWGWSNSFVSSL